MAAGDKITEGMRILAALAAVAQDPTPLSALKAGPGLLDSLKKIAASPPASFARLAEDLGRSGAAAFEALPEKPRDAEVLYLQMVEAGLPDPARIMADRMDAAAVTERMLAGLTEREHRDPAMQALFRALTRPALERLLADKAFAADLTPAFMRAVLGNFVGMAEKLDSISRQGRDVLEVLAVRFDIARVYDLTDAQLREQLELRAADYRRFQNQIAAIDERIRGLGNLKAAARNAAERLDFAEIEELLSHVHGVELEVAVETAILRADNALLQGQIESAYRILSSAADSFAGVSPIEAVKKRLMFEERLFEHGQRYGGPGLKLSEQMVRRAIDDLPETGMTDLEVAALLKLAHTLQVQGRSRSDEGANQLELAAVIYRTIINYYHESHNLEMWAATNNNLGMLLVELGEREVGTDRITLLGEAMDAFRSALEIQTAAEDRMERARTYNNLSIALRALGSQTAGSNGEALLREAADACREALNIIVVTENPREWGTFQHSLGNALGSLAGRVSGTPGLRLLGQSVEAYIRAKSVRTREGEPVLWASTCHNTGIAMMNFAIRIGGAKKIEMLHGALDFCRLAFQVYQEDTFPMEWAGTKATAGIIYSSLAEIGKDDRFALNAAAMHLEATLRVYSADSTPAQYAEVNKKLARVRAKLAALPDPA